MRKKLLKLLREIEEGDRLPVAPREFSENRDDMPTEEDYRIFEREVEREQQFKNEYEDFDGEFQCFYDVEEFLDFPNYRYLINLFNKKYSVLDENGRQLSVTRNSILAELNRMEADGLVMISTQEGEVYAHPAQHGGGPENGGKIISEKIVLTTKGKSNFEYFLYQLEEQRLAFYALVLSVFSTVVSVVALFSK